MTTTWELIIIFIILLTGSFLQGVSGFGFGLFSMGLVPYLLSLKDSTLLVLALTIFISLHVAIKLKQYIRIKEVLLIIGAALIGRILSFFLLLSFGEMDSMKKWLGFILIGMIIYLYYSEKNKSDFLMMKPMYIIGIGFIGGLIGGIFAVGGPFFVFYFLMRYEEKKLYNANLQASFVVINSFTVLLHGLNGDFHINLFLYLFIGVFAVGIGVNFGLKWFDRLPREKIKHLASIIVIISAVNLHIFS